MADDNGQPRYEGIRYESRIRSGWECWALFDDEDLELEVLETLPIASDMPALQRVARLFELQVFYAAPETRFARSESGAPSGQHGTRVV
jgi:hypothetical protein